MDSQSRIEEKAYRVAKSWLSTYVGKPANSEAQEIISSWSRDGYQRADAILVIPPFRFLLEIKASGTAGPITAAIQFMQRWSLQTDQHSASAHQGSEQPIEIPLVVVPFMGDVGKELCDQAGMSWLDFAGNARITAPGLRIWIEGHPNPEPRPAEAANPFAPRAARLVRSLLLWPTHTWTQQLLCEYTGLDKGFVSKLVRSLVSQGFIEETREYRTNVQSHPNEGHSHDAAPSWPSGLSLGDRWWNRRPLGPLDAQTPEDRQAPSWQDLREYHPESPDGRQTNMGGRRGYGVVNPAALLEAWREEYAFEKHDIHYGLIAARSGVELLQRLVQALDTPSRPAGHIAATGLAAASQLAPYADFRTVTLYCQSLPHPDTLDQIGFRREARGSNVWLVIPNDAGVFMGAGYVNGIPCVSAVQTYLDLFAQPERAKDAATELRKKWLPWSIADRHASSEQDV